MQMHSMNVSVFYCFSYRCIQKRTTSIEVVLLYDDPYGIRTRVTAVKGRCLNRLTNGPQRYGSGGGDRTPDLTGMNRTL